MNQRLGVALATRKDFRKREKNNPSEPVLEVALKDFHKCEKIMAAFRVVCVFPGSDCLSG
jgi:hypothetical protein